MCDAAICRDRLLPRYFFEAASLGLFMVAACIVTGLVETPGLPLRSSVQDPLVRRSLIGTAMGLTAIAITYSPWGRTFGAHLNPAFTVTMARLGRICPRRAAIYIASQSVGAITGVALSALLFPGIVSNASVNYVVTVPGSLGATGAFVAEFAMSLVVMLFVLNAERLPRVARVAGFGVGVLIAVFITFEAPLSGMSLNPARSLASAVLANTWTGMWIYIAAPVLGMLAAAELHVRTRWLGNV